MKKLTGSMMEWDYKLTPVSTSDSILMIQVKLDALGKEGWEMVAISDGIIYCKRPVISHTEVMCLVNHQYFANKN